MKYCLNFTINLLKIYIHTDFLNINSHIYSSLYCRSFLTDTTLHIDSFKRNMTDTQIEHDIFLKLILRVRLT